MQFDLDNGDAEGFAVSAKGEANLGALNGKKPSEIFSADCWGQIQTIFKTQDRWQGAVTWTWMGNVFESQMEGFRSLNNPTKVLLLHNQTLENEYALQKMSRMAQLVSVGEVASGIAHEINTPLSVMSGRLALIKRGVQKNPIDIDKLKADCDQVETVIGRIALMVKGIRNLSKAGDKDPFVPTDMMTIIENLRSITEDKAIRTGVQLTFEGGPCALQCREVQIAQVLLNLVNNSFDAIEALSTKWIMVAWLVKGDRVEISVTDSGPRVSDELAEKILLPYFSTKAPGKGTGLGLSLSLRIIQDHNGVLKLNRASENMQFIIDIPLKHN